MTRLERSEPRNVMNGLKVNVRINQTFGYSVGAGHYFVVDAMGSRVNPSRWHSTLAGLKLAVREGSYS